jgi:hypothetical protein
MNILAVDGKACKPAAPGREPIDAWAVRGYLISIYRKRAITRDEFIRRWGLLYGK